MISTALVREFEAVRLGLIRAGIPAGERFSLSVRDDTRLVVTAAHLSDRPLQYADLISTNLLYRDGNAPLAADLELHRAIYKDTRHRSVLISRPPHAMTLACLREKLTTPAGDIPVLLEAGPDSQKALLKTLVRSSLLLHRNQAAICARLTPQDCLSLTAALEEACVATLTAAQK